MEQLLGEKISLMESVSIRASLGEFRASLGEIRASSGEIRGLIGMIENHSVLSQSLTISVWTWGAEFGNAQYLSVSCVQYHLSLEAHSWLI